MIPPFDVFSVEADGTPIWRAAAASLEIAKARVEELGKSCPGEYMIVSITTGSRAVVARKLLGFTEGNQGASDARSPNRS